MEGGDENEVSTRSIKLGLLPMICFYLLWWF